MSVYGSNDSSGGAPMAPPGGLVTIAWLWISSGVLLLFAGLLTFVADGGGAALELTQLKAAGLLPPNFELRLEALTALERHSSALGWGQLVIGLAAAIGGYYLLRCRYWARVLVEVLTWATLVYLGWGYFLWMGLWDGLVAALGEYYRLDGAALHGLGNVLGISMVVLFAAPMVWVLFYLHGAKVRRAVASARRSRRGGIR